MGEENREVQQASTEPDTPTQSSQAEESKTAAARPSTDDQAHNWKEMRSAMKELAEKNKAMEAELAHMRPPKQEDADELDSLANDDIITKQQMMQFGKKLHKKAKEEAFSEFYNKTAEERLELKYSDFRSVTSPENIEKLKERFPDLAKSIASNKDAYSQGKAVYDMISSLGLHNKDTETNREKMQANMQKPQMGGAVATKQGPLDSAHLFESGQRPGLTKSLKETLRKEMDDAIKGH